MEGCLLQAMSASTLTVDAKLEVRPETPEVRGALLLVRCNLNQSLEYESLNKVSLRHNMSWIPLYMISSILCGHTMKST